MKQPFIQFKNVFKAFGENRVLNGVEFSIYKGEVTTVIGKSGTGKSVLLKHIIGLVAPDSGAILIDGKPLSRMKRAEKKAMKRKFSYMFQGTALFDSMTVSENIALPLEERSGVSKAKIRGLVEDKLKQLELTDIGDKYPSQLSGGMKKRVALARALVTDPEVVLFDEPTTGLDPIRKNAVHSMISDYQKQFGFTAVLVSHEIPDVFYISQRVAMLNEGQILFEGSPEEIKNASNPLVQWFIQGLEGRQDELTGMAHPSQGEKRFREEMARMERYQNVFSLILLTIENLDQVNEKVGYDAGQSAFKNFADQMRRHLRMTDIFSRYGINKILVILPNTDLDQARTVRGKLTKEMEIGHIKTEDVSEISDTDYPEEWRIETRSGLWFSVRVGVAEATKESVMEDVVAVAESNESMTYRFKIIR